MMREPKIAKNVLHKDYDWMIYSIRFFVVGKGM